MKVYDRGGIVIREAVMADIDALAGNLRRRDSDEVLAAGFPSERDALEYSFSRSEVRLTVERDGVPLAMFGLVPGPEGAPACAWLLGAQGLGAIKKSFVKLARITLDIFLANYPVIYNYVDERYTDTIRWLEACGARFEPPAPYGALGRPFQRFTIRRA